MLADYLPELREYIMYNGDKAMTFDSRTFVPFLFKTLPLMRLLGVEVALPKSLRELISPKISVKVTASKTFVQPKSLSCLSKPPAPVSI